MESFKKWVMNQITITNNTISYNHQIIKTSNISSVDLKKVARGNSKFLIIVGIICVLDFIAMFISTRADARVVTSKGLINMVIMAGIAVLCFWLNERRKRNSLQYVLFIQTNAGAGQLFGHKDYSFVNSIRNRILEVLNNSGIPMNYTYNIDNKTVINNPTGPLTITQVNNYTGLSNADKLFLTQQFEPALQRIKETLEQSNNEQLKRDFEMLRSELKSSKPRRSILQTTWSSLGTLGNLAELASVMERAINLF